MKTLMVITYWSFYDALIQSYTLPYVRIIKNILPKDYKIILVTFDKEPKQFESEIEPGIYNISFRMHGFGLKAIMEVFYSLLKLKKVVKSRNVFALHGWCATGNGLAWALSKISGLRFIADSFEPNAEPMVETGTWKKNSIAFRIQFWLEKKTARFAGELIAISPHMQGYMESKYHINREIKYIKPACVDIDLFHTSRKKNHKLLRELDLEGKIVCVYAGKTGGFYLDQELFDFFAAASKKWGELFRVIFLSSQTKDTLLPFIRKSGFPEHQLILKFIPHYLVPDYMGLADFAVGPYKSVPSRKTCSPLKNGEYLALGLPIVITPDISNDSELIELYNCGVVLRDLSQNDYMEALDKIEKMIADDHVKNATAERCRQIAETYRNFDIAYKIYQDIYGHLS
ncbi:MAG: hypothetical protein Fur0041_03250 [Bacteroidia bacterium]